MNMLTREDLEILQNALRAYEIDENTKFNYRINNSIIGDFQAQHREQLAKIALRSKIELLSMKLKELEQSL